MPVTPSILPHQPALIYQSYPFNPAPSTCSIIPVTFNPAPSTCSNIITHIYLSISGGAGCCLQITGIKAPRLVLTGERVHLSCSFRLDGDTLYSLTWWKDDKIFYRFIPKSSPPGAVFPLPGITVDERISSLHQVTLSQVDHRASGKLRCEVLGDSPNFEQDTMDSNITVIAKPESGPSLTGVQGPYTVGHLLLVNCSSPFSYPPTTLTWHINGHQVSLVKKYEVENCQSLVSDISDKSETNDQSPDQIIFDINQYNYTNIEN
nr:uncharacterized protein LOC128697298 [Cherax quadricarinatus]